MWLIMVILKGKIDGDINIGLYAIVNNQIAIVPKILSFNLDIAEVFKVRVIKASIYNTPFIGIFACMNDNGILLSDIISDNEKKALKKALKEEGVDINVGFLKARENVIGNLILCNNKGALISKTLIKYKKEIADILNVDVEIGKIMDLDLVGSLGVANNKGFLISAYAEEEEYEKVKEVLGVDGDIGTVNYGSPYVKSGILVNDTSLVVGDITTPIELGRATESLGFL